MGTAENFKHILKGNTSHIFKYLMSVYENSTQNL